MPDNPSGVTLQAKAKLNLRLEVLGLRPDGYHDITSVFHQIDLADQVSVEIDLGPGDPTRACIEVRCSPQVELGGRANIAHRAASLYLAAWLQAGRQAMRPPAIRIDILKRIPVAAGLGGGSSDAAAVLRALHRQLGPLVSGGGGDQGRAAPIAGSIDLAGLGAEIGSDVPFFLAGGAAFVRGRGEQVTSLRTNLVLPVLLAVPAFGVSAREAYSWWDTDQSDRGGAEDDARNPGLDGQSWRPEALQPETLLRPGSVRNDLAGPVIRRFPVVGELIRKFAAMRALAAGMTGSGPVVFGIFSDDASAAGAEAVLRQTYPRVEFVRSRLDPVPTGGGDAIWRGGL